MRLFIKTLLGAALSASLAVSAQTLPQIKILATGGTIAGTAASATQTTGYKAGDLGIQVLIEAVPQMKEFADVSGEQIFKISSNRHRDYARYGHSGRDRLLPEPYRQEQEACGAWRRHASGNSHFG